MTPTEPLTVTVPEAARLIGVAKSTVYKAIYETGMVLEGVPALKVRGTWRVSRSQLMDVLKPPRPTEAAS